MSRRRSPAVSFLRMVTPPLPFGLRSYLRAMADRYRFWRDYRAYCHLAPDNAQPALEHLSPCLTDATAETPIDFSYYYQDAWAFELILV